MIIIEEALRITGIGIGATIVMDVWSLILNKCGSSTLNYALVGRWIIYFRQKKFYHQNIAKAAPVKGELVLGWLSHYVIGIIFSILFIGLIDVSWLHNPTALPALIFGVITVIFPFFIMQPCMGAGFAAAKTVTPFKNRLKSLLTHTIFGFGLYLSAIMLSQIGIR